MNFTHERHARAHARNALVWKIAHITWAADAYVAVFFAAFWR